MEDLGKTLKECLVGVITEWNLNYEDLKIYQFTNASNSFGTLVSGDVQISDLKDNFKFPFVIRKYIYNSLKSGNFSNLF